MTRDAFTETDVIAEAQRLANGYDTTDYAELCSEISDGFMGETGDLVREHAKLIQAIRLLTAENERISVAWAECADRAEWKWNGD